MTTENVTVLFTDMVGSTALASSVVQDAADELRREHFSILRRAIFEAGGTEVKNLGDGLMVVFSAASAALSCAAAMQQGIERDNRDRESMVGLRVGLSVGEVSREDDDYFGDPVVEAARLCAACESGQILATDIVRAMAGRRSSHECRPLGELVLKGLPDPVEAVEVLWEPVDVVVDGGADGIAVALPSRVEKASSAAFVGRAQEREGLDESLKTAAAGERRVILVSGEPGIGKTALSSVFARQAFERGAVVLYGRCDEDLGIPYQPWAEALTHLVRHVSDDLLAAHTDARGGELARLAPDLATRASVGGASTGDGESERYLLFGAVVDVLSRVSALAPVVLVLDDLHWADRQTVQLLRHVVSADVPLRLFVIGTFRESDVGTDHPLTEALAALHREAGVERLALRGLGDDELLALLETTAGHEMAEEGVALRDALLAETDGNPFYVGEMLRHLAETRAIYQDERGRWIASPDLRASGLPVSIREVVGRRVARLGAQTQGVLSLAAVIGRDFDAVLLARVAQLDEDSLLDVCDEAVAAAVLTEADVAGRYAFANGLIEHTLYDNLSAGRRARAHRMVAEVLEELCGDDPAERIGELAYHWAHATQPQDSGKAIEYAQRAGDRALAQLAPDEARRWYQDALDLLGRAPTVDSRRRAVLLLGLGEAQQQAGDPAHRETLLESAHLADSIDAIDVLVRAALRNNRGFQSIVGVVDRERVDVLALALARLGGGDSPDRARLLALSCLERNIDADFDERLALATEAVDIARRTGDKAALVDAIRLCHEAITMPQTLELRRSWNAEACALADELGDPTARLLANDSRCLAALEAGDIATIRAAHAIFASESERIGQPFNRWQIAYHAAWLRMLEGDLDGAEQAATEALTLGSEAGQPDAVTFFGAQIINVRSLQGRLPEMVAPIEQAVHDNPGLPVYRPALVWAKSFDDPDGDDLRRLLDAEVTNDFPMWADNNWLLAHVLWAEAAARSGHQLAATVLYERLLPWHDHFGTSHITLAGSVAHFLGVLAHVLDRHDEADEWFAEALAFHEAMETPHFVAQTQVAWASLRADCNLPGDAERARALVEAALPVATERGFGQVERDARAVLERIE